MTIVLSLSNLINVLFIAAGLGICGMGFFHVGSGMHIRPEVKKYFQLFFTLINTYISMHLLRMLMEGHTDSINVVGIRVVTFIEFLVSGFMIYLLALLILFISDSGKTARISSYVLLVLVILHTVGLIINLFSGFYYTFDANNYYQRSPGYAVSNTMHVLMLIQMIFILIRYRDRFDRKLAAALWFYLVSPLVAIVLQLFFKEVQFIILATVISAAFLYYEIIRIQTEKYQGQQKDKERLDTELSMATRIQAETLPNIYPAFPERADFDVYASMTPAKEIGGDFYDFFLIDDTHLGIVMADVSGKGVPAALFMMVSKILIQNIAMMGNSPAETLKYVNNQLCANNPEEMFVTVWYGCLDLETGVLDAANAGHEYPVFKNRGESFELIKDKHGFVIGGMEGAVYNAYSIQMDPGSKLFIYTDGVPEATNSDGEMFGTDRLVEALRQAESRSPRQILEHVDASVKDFVKGAPQFDDLTMLCIEFNGTQLKRK